MNNEDFMNLLSASVNDNHQAQAQAPVDHSVWGYFDTHGNYFSPSQTALDPLMGVPGPTTSNENETNRMLGEIQAAVEMIRTELQSLSEKQADMDEKLNHMIDDMGAFSKEAIHAWEEVYYQLTGERGLRQPFTEEVNSQSGDESSWEEGVSRSGRASV